MARRNIPPALLIFALPVACVAALSGGGTKPPTATPTYAPSSASPSGPPIVFTSLETAGGPAKLTGGFVTPEDIARSSAPVAPSPPTSHPEAPTSPRRALNRAERPREASGQASRAAPSETPSPLNPGRRSRRPEVVPGEAHEEQLQNHGRYVNKYGVSVHAPSRAVGGGAPDGATARCGDGTYSFSQHRRGTCSRHGGAVAWLR